MVWCLQTTGPTRSICLWFETSWGRDPESAVGETGRGEAGPLALGRSGIVDLWSVTDWVLLERPVQRGLAGLRGIWIFDFLGRSPEVGVGETGRGEAGPLARCPPSCQKLSGCLGCFLFGHVRQPVHQNGLVLSVFSDFGVGEADFWWATDWGSGSQSRDGECPADRVQGVGRLVVGDLQRRVARLEG